MSPPLYLSKEQLLYRMSPKTRKPALISCLRLRRSPREEPPAPEVGAASGRDSGRAAKRVTFADHRGLSLTRVKVFSQFDDPIDIPVNIQEMLRCALTLAAEEDKLVLDFAQPSSDYLRFRQSLEKNFVCLEHCVLKEKALAGTVKVKNVSFEKSVKVRLTSDGWRSHRDVACEYVKDSYPTASSDTFSFCAPLPERLRPHEHVEFAVCYQVGGQEYWDSNQGGSNQGGSTQGGNYRIVWASARRGRPGGPGWNADSIDFGIHFDRYGSPTCSHGIFPDWPSYAGHDHTGPYY